MKRIALMLIIPLLLFVNSVSAEDRSIKEEVIYDIFVDRFNNGDSNLAEQVDVDDPLTYNGGDLRGIITKLDHIQEYGFTTISISSIMENAPEGYHGYWIEDFYNVEEQLGTMEDLQDLVAEAHKRDLKVIMEMVPNYIALSHPIATDSAKQDWVVDNTIEPKDSIYWLEDVKVLNQENPEVRDYLIEVADFWMDEVAIDGFKLHAADQSSQQFLEELSIHVKDKNPDFYLIASTLDENGVIELSEATLMDAVENNQLLQVMNDVLTGIDRPISDIFDVWEESNDHYNLLTVDNKTTARFSNNLRDNGRNSITVWQMALTYLYTAPGVPMIYQGSELPMYGPGFPENQQLMQFNSTDPDMEEVHSRISAIRHQFPSLAHGSYEQVGTHDSLSVFKRSYEDETIYVAINNGSESRAITLTDIDSDVQLRGLIADNTVRENKNGEFIVGIPRESTEIYRVEPDTGFNWIFIGFLVGVFTLFIAFVVTAGRKQKKASSN